MALSKAEKSKEKGRVPFDSEVKPATLSNDNNKLPASSIGSLKDSMSVKPSIVSPPRGRKTKQELMKTRAFPTGWYIRSCLVQGGLEVITITTNTLSDDAYTNPLVKEIEGGPENGPIAKLTLLGAFSMRVSLINPNPLLNKKSTYHRKAFIRVLDDNELDCETRLSGLKVIKSFIEECKDFSYKTAVFIDPGWNLNLTMEDMPKLDHFLQYGEIVRVINKLFDEVDWKEVQCYLTEGHIPPQAVNDLNCPLNNITTN